MISITAHVKICIISYFELNPVFFLHVITHYEYEGEFPNLHALIWLL